MLQYYELVSRVEEEPLIMSMPRSRRRGDDLQQASCNVGLVVARFVRLPRHEEAQKQIRW
jgi:hypothetical protein